MAPSAQPPPITVVIVNYNGGALLAACVGDALAQGRDVVVVDNASTDASLRDLPSEAPTLRIIRNATNRGFAAACNQGLIGVQGDSLLLNPDCRLGEGAIRALHTTLHAAPDVGLAGPLLSNPDGTEQRGGRRRLPTPRRALGRALGVTGRARGFAVTGFEYAETELPKTATDVEALSGACLAIRGDAMAGVGGLDEGYFMHCEDLDWCRRFRTAGWRACFVPTAVVTHYKGACSSPRPAFVAWHKHRGMGRYYRKHLAGRYPALLLVLVLLAVWGRFAVLMPVFAFRGLRARWGIAHGD